MNIISKQMNFCSLESMWSICDFSNVLYLHFYILHESSIHLISATNIIQKLCINLPDVLNLHKKGELKISDTSPNYKKKKSIYISRNSISLRITT